MNSRWCVYQKERFPVVAHGPMVVVFVLSVLLFSSLQEADIPDWYRIAGAAVSALIFFFQLRVADEHKDFEEDARWRPHRAVPRGLVSLDELAKLAWAGAGIQFVIAVSIDIGLVPILFVVWAYIGLMSVEFFVPAWLKRTQSVYLLSHMLVMPLIAFYVSAFDWLCECREMPAGLSWLLLLAFACGLVLELGRKIRPAEAEREGVATYSAIWGGPLSIRLWYLAVAVAVSAYLMAVAYIGDGWLNSMIAASVLIVGAMLAVSFPRDGADRFTGKLIEPGSALVALLLYLGLGPIQLLV